MITVAAGQNAALVWQPGAVLTGAEVTISPGGGGAAVLGPTSDGLGASGAVYTLVWQVPSDTAQGPYTAVLEGLDDAEPVTVEVDVYVTALPVYATLAELKHALGITDTERDAALAGKLASASRSIDKDTGGRRFWLDTTAQPRVINPRRRVVADEDGQRLLTADIGDADDLVVEAGRAGAWADITAGVEAQPTDALQQQRPVTSLLRLGGTWPAGGGQRVRVTARWGWPAVPDEVHEATLILAARLYKRKDSPEGVLGSSEWGVVRLSRRDPDVLTLIEHLIDYGLA